MEYITTKVDDHSKYGGVHCSDGWILGAEKKAKHMADSIRCGKACLWAQKGEQA